MVITTYTGSRAVWT